MNTTKKQILEVEYSEYDFTQLEQESRLRGFNAESYESTIEEFDRKIEELKRKKAFTGNLLQDEYDRLEVVNEIRLD